MSSTLTKTLFVAGVQCPKLLWWKVHDRDAVELQPDRVLQDRFDQGAMVGELARQRFPGGVLIEHRGTRSERVAETRRALDDGATVLYEAAFAAQGVFVAVDVLHQHSGRWHLTEVKSASRCKQEHVIDAAVQTYVLGASEVFPASVEVMHLNGEFRSPGHGEFFARTDVTRAVAGELWMMPDRIAEQLDVLASPTPPNADLGMRCFEPYGCVFHERCWPSHARHISTLYNVGSTATCQYMAKGVHTLDDLAPGERLQAPARRQLRALACGEMIVEPTLAHALEDFTVTPLGFLDFETVSRAIPPWDGLGPWANTAAQFSYHELTPGKPLRHEEYLAEGPLDCRPELARRLVDATVGAAKVVTYSGFEKARIRELQRAVPELSDELGALEEKLVDLLPVMRDHVYHPDFRGSFSLKQVLPALVPGLTYNDLVIVDGLVASVEIARLLFVADRIPAHEKERVRRDLLDYCERDTMAMVRLLERLWGLATARR